MTIIILMCLILVSGCSGGESERGVVHEHILVDRSLSVPAERFDGFARRIVQQADEWASIAKPSSRLGVWRLPAGRSYTYPAIDTTFTMETLHAPVHVQRKRIRKAVCREVERVVSGFPPTMKTPLLEAIFYIGSSMPPGRVWGLTIYSDLIHDGKTWSFPSRLDGISDKEVIDQMKKICPPVNNPPQRITIVSWPGMVNRRETSVEIHQRVMKVYEAFLADWAPGSQLEIGSIY